MYRVSRWYIGRVEPAIRHAFGGSYALSTICLIPNGLDRANWWAARGMPSSFCLTRYYYGRFY